MSLCHRTHLFPTRVASSLISPSTTIKYRPNIYYKKSTHPSRPLSPSSYSLFHSSPSTTTSLCVSITQSCAGQRSVRRYSASTQRTVDLAFSALAPTHAPGVESNGLRNILVLHGLFGSGNNWRGMSKRLSDTTNSNVYLMDLRNHGVSPHSEEIDYEIMAEDVKAFIDKHSLQDVSIIGHSMGGKTSMVLALKYPELVKKLLIVDIAPYSLENAQTTFNSYSAAMLAIDFHNLKTRKQVDEALLPAVPDTGVRQFLMTNLVIGGEELSWKCNVPVLHNSMAKIMDFPKLNATYNGPTFFIGGSNSNYISNKQLPTIKKFFPTSEVIHLQGAGHWVHAEKPQEFLDAATEFLNK